MKNEGIVRKVVRSYERIGVRIEMRTKGVILGVEIKSYENEGVPLRDAPGPLAVENVACSEYVLERSLNT